MFASLHRRRFLAVSSVAGAAWLDGARILSAVEEKDEWGGFPIGIQTISLRKYKLPEVMRHLRGMSVRYIEFSASTHLPSSASDEQIAETRSLAALAELKVTAHGVNRFSKDHVANQRVFEF